MNRAEFFKKLEQGLSRVPREEAEAALEYYNEYFDEAGEENEQKIIEELGSPSQIAARVKAESAIKELNESPEPSVKKGISAIWFILLAILSAPIALPLAIAAAAVVIAIVIAAICVVIGLIVSVAAFFLAGIVMLIAGIGVIAVSLPSAIFTIGVGLAMLGATIIIGILVMLAARGIFGGLARSMNRKLQNKSKGGQINE